MKIENTETIQPPRYLENEMTEHKDLILFSEANGMTLLKSVITGKVYGVSKNEYPNRISFEVKELMSHQNGTR